MIDTHFQGNRRVVLYVRHGVDDEGHVIHVELEPLPDASPLHVVEAAWQHARRCHPWIIGDEAAAKLELSYRIGLSQVGNLMTAANEALVAIAAGATGGGIEQKAIERLRGAVIDLRGYMPALCGQMHEEPQIQFKMRRAG